jgi:hypothetical protein
MQALKGAEKVLAVQEIYTFSMALFLYILLTNNLLGLPLTCLVLAELSLNENFNSYPFDGHLLAAGSYAIRLSNSEGSVSYRFIKGM